MSTYSEGSAAIDAALLDPPGEKMFVLRKLRDARDAYYADFVARFIDAALEG